MHINICYGLQSLGQGREDRLACMQKSTNYIQKSEFIHISALLLTNSKAVEMKDQHRRAHQGAVGWGGVQF